VPPSCSIYGTIGNHDNFPGDKFPHPFEGYRAISDIWGPWLDTEAKATIVDGGYYAQEVKAGLSLISINTLYLSTINPFVLDAENPARAFGFTMMDWFSRELKKAAEKGNKVWVLGHIPANLWLQEHEVRYQKLIEAHASIVQGQFYGHNHEDYATLTRRCETDESCSGDPTGIVWVGPSLTEGWPAENPAIRQYVYGNEGGETSYQILESLTHWANLTKANQVGHVDWELEYDMRELFQMKDLQPASWLSVVERMRTDNKTWADHYAVRRRLYDGVMSGSSGSKCRNHNMTCALPLICEMSYFQQEMVKNCSAGMPRQVKAADLMSHHYKR